MFEFLNAVTDEILTHVEFVTFVWDEAKRQFEELNDEVWSNLGKEEQISLYCQQYEHQLNNRDWKIIK